MKEYTTKFIRNVALVSHGGAGKTMLGESFLHATGATTRLGKVEDGTAVSDYDDEEHKRKISIYASVIPIEHRDHKINVIDAPGYTDFVGEAVSALSVADGADVVEQPPRSAVLAADHDLEAAVPPLLDDPDTFPADVRIGVELPSDVVDGRFQLLRGVVAGSVPVVSANRTIQFLGGTA